MLLHIPQLLTPEEAAQCRSQLEQAPWQSGRATAGHAAAQVKHNQQLPLSDPLAQSLAALILERLGRHPLFISAALPLKVLPPRFNRYADAGYYGRHVDNAIMGAAGSDTKVRTDVSSTLFLSEPASYEGGELEIEDTYSTQRIKLAAGDLLVYPGESLHRVTPVTRGVRYAAFFWTQSLIAQTSQRRMLYEMDRAIQRLATDHPGHDSIDSLTGIYHNLLRQWSTT